MDVVVQKDAIERDLAVVKGKNEQFQKELSRHQHRLLVVERDLRQAKVCTELSGYFCIMQCMYTCSYLNVWYGNRFLYI